jgi:hypothetical protein
MKKFKLLFLSGLLSLSLGALSQIQVNSNGDFTIKHQTFSQGNDAVLYLGNTEHYIKSVFGYGVKIGTSGMADWIRIKAWTGGVGINRDPQYSLDVNGNIRAQTTLYTSDIRFKTNIQNMENPINKLRQIQGVSYNFSSNDTTHQKYVEHSNFNKNFGFIAQDFQKIYPELVYEDSEGYLSIDYVSVIPILLEAIKEQQLQIEELKRAIGK